MIQELECLTQMSNWTRDLRAYTFQCSATVIRAALFSGTDRVGRQRRSAAPRFGPRCLTGWQRLVYSSPHDLSADFVAETDVIRFVHHRHATSSQVVQKTLVVGGGGPSEYRCSGKRDKRRNDPSKVMSYETSDLKRISRNSLPKALSEVESNC